MTALAIDKGFGGFFDTGAFKKYIQDHAFELVRKISKAVTDAMFIDSETVAEDVRRKFEEEVSRANAGLDHINRGLAELHYGYPAVYADLTKHLGKVSVGTEKIDPDGKIALQVAFITNLCSIVAGNARGARQEIEESDINSLALYDSIAQLSFLEKNLRLLFEEVQELGERVVIHDSLTEAPEDISDDPLFAEFAGESHA